MEFLTQILIMSMQFELKIKFHKWSVYSTKNAVKLLIFSLEILIQSLSLKNTIYLNFKMKFNLKMYSWSVNISMIYQQPSIFGNCFTLGSDIHIYNTAKSSTGRLSKFSFRTDLHGKESITITVFNSQNKIQTAPGAVILKNLTTNKVKSPTNLKLRLLLLLLLLMLLFILLSLLFLSSSL